MAIAALIPLRNGKRLVPSAAPSSSLSEATGVGPRQHNNNLLPASPLPWIPLSSSCSSTSTTAVIVGRRELLTCLWKACGCHDDVTTSRHKCDACQLVNTWALSALSRHMLQFQIAAPNSKTTAKAPTATTTAVKLWVRGRHADALLDIQPKPQPSDSPEQMPATSKDGDHDWIGPWTLAPHTILTFQPSSGMADNDNASSDVTVDAALSFKLVQVDAQSGQVLEDAPPQMSSSSSCTTTLKTKEDSEMNPSKTPLQPQDSSTSIDSGTNSHDSEEEETRMVDSPAENQSGKPVNYSPPKEIHSKSLEATQDIVHQNSCCDTADARVECAVRSPSDMSSSTNRQSEVITVEMDLDSNNDESHNSQQSDGGGSSVETHGTENDDNFSGWQTQVPLPPVTTASDALALDENLANIESDPSPAIHEHASCSVPLPSSTEGDSADRHTPSRLGTNQGGDEETHTDNLHASTGTDGQALPSSGDQAFSDPVAKKEVFDQLKTATIIAKSSKDQAAQSIETHSLMHPMEPVKLEPSNPLESNELVVMDGLTSTNHAFASSSHNLDHNKIDAPETAHTVPSDRPISPNQQQHELQQHQQPILYFVRRGGLSQKRIQLLSKNARNKGAVVLDHLAPVRPNSNNSRTTTPTHLVLESTTSVSALLAEVQLSDEDALREWLQQNGIQCVTTAWITKGESLEMPLPPTSRWYKLSPQRKRPTSCGGQQNETDEHNQNETRKRPRSGSRPVTPSFDDEDQNGSNEDDNKLPSSPKGRNAKLSELFLKLSKLHQSCPLLSEDSWKAYSFHVTAGRLRHLEFEIRDDPALLAKVRQIRGFGDSTLRMIQEYLSSGTFQRIDAFEADPDRIAMKRMMDIWGVGRVKASELVRQGYKDIAQVRKGLESRKLDLDRNQRIGVECYEDILEEMDRSEVETIGSIVAKAAQEIVPGVEAMIMGSYRRGKLGCGDVDVFLTDKDHFDQIPPTALGRIVDKLREWGHIAFHLTHLQGMKSSDDLGKRNWSNKPPEKEISTYFGVFHSPVVNGKRRRVDIKFFPYRERVFAALYFTGNGFFNRSMRLWASRKFKWLLNEKGLFTRDMRMRVLEADTERQVFDHLRLVYKEPHERDCFDAVQPVDGSEDGPLEVSRAEISRDDNEHRWID